MRRTVLMIAVFIGLGGGALAQDANLMRFQPGQMVKVTVYTADMIPTQSMVWTAPDEAIQVITRADRAAAQKQALDLAGCVMLGHNTRAFVENVTTWEINGKHVPAAQIRVGEGSLKGQLVYITMRRLRASNEPDPCARYNARSLYEMSWDAEFSPTVESTVLLVGKTAGDKPTGVTLWPGVEPARLVTTPIDSTSLESDSLYASPGTRAKVIELRPGTAATSTYVRVRILSGPFEGLSAWTLSLNCARPEIYQQATANLAAEIK